jgi:hypothetical protein
VGIACAASNSVADLTKEQDAHSAMSNTGDKTGRTAVVAEQLASNTALRPKNEPESFALLQASARACCHFLSNKSVCKLLHCNSPYKALPALLMTMSSVPPSVTPNSHAGMSKLCSTETLSESNTLGKMATSQRTLIQRSWTKMLITL